MSNASLNLLTDDVFVTLNGFNAEQRERVFTKVGIAAVDAAVNRKTFDSTAALVQAVGEVNRKRYDVYLTIDEDGKVDACITGGGASPRHVVINTFDEYVDLCNEDVAASVRCSSSLDFPRDYTKNRTVIALCDQIRNGA